MIAPALDIDFDLRAEPLPNGRTRITFFTRAERKRWLLVESYLRGLGWVAPADVAPRLWSAARLTRPTVTLCVPVRVYASSTPGRHHLYIDAELTWGRYLRLLELLHRADILRGSFYPWALERAMTMLLRPGLMKARVREAAQLDMLSQHDRAEAAE
jgi:hypothetical protein